MDAKWILALVFACAVCYTKAQLLIATPTTTNVLDRNNCGCSKLCVSSPSTCDPSGIASCYFSSFQPYSNNMVMFELSGTTDGYVALGISPENQDTGRSLVFVCSASISKIVYPPSGTASSFWAFNDQTIINSINTAVMGRARTKRSIGLTKCAFLMDISSMTSSGLVSSTKQISAVVSILKGPMTSETELGVPTRMYYSQTPLNLMNTTANGPCSLTSYQSGSGSSSGSGNSGSGSSGSGSSGSGISSGSGSSGGISYSSFSNSNGAADISSSATGNSRASFGIHALFILLSALLFL